MESIKAREISVQDALYECITVGLAVFRRPGGRAGCTALDSVKLRRDMKILSEKVKTGAYLAEIIILSYKTIPI